MAAQRAAGDADFAILNEQLSPSALLVLPAANAALVALMQNTSKAAARISIARLMIVVPPGNDRDVASSGSHSSTMRRPPNCGKIGPVLA